MLTLNRLDRRDRAALVDQIAGGKALPHEVVAQIVDRTDGVPLFVEELTKSLLEGGLLRAEVDRFVLEGALPPLAVPATLHASLMARLDRLASGTAGGPDRRCDRTRVSLRAAACRLSPSRRRTASCNHTPRRLRAGVPARHTA